MIFTFFTIITFIAEVIIACAIVVSIKRIDRYVLSFDIALQDSRANIKDIALLTKKISEQFVEFSEDFVEKVHEEEENFVIKQLNRILIAFLLYKINIKPIKKFRKSKLGKSLAKGFSLLQNMV